MSDQEVVEQEVSFLSVIDKAASSPDVDAEKLHRILDAQERILDREARMAFNRDFAAMSEELPTITERGQILNKQGTVQSTYARWDEDINPTIKPILSRFGFSLRFRTSMENGLQAITAILAHKEGHSEETTIHLPRDESGNKNSVQGVGSSTSYGKRYAASALLNLTTHGQDDDGQTAEAISEEQVAEIEGRIEKLLESGKMDDSKPFFDWLRRELKVSDLAELNHRGYETVCEQLEKKEKGKASKKKGSK